jgi:Tfp pilus assembly protein PilF
MSGFYRKTRRWFKARPRRKKYLRNGLIAFGVILTIAVSARPVSHLIKKWQAQRLAAEATVFMEKEDYAQASKKSLDALRLRPDEPAAMDAAAHLLSRTGQSIAALGWWKKIEATRPLTVSDRREYAGAAMDCGELALAASLIDPLLAQKPSVPPNDMVLAAKLQTLKGNSTGAIDYAEQVLNDPKSPSQCVLDSAVVIIANTTPQSLSYGRAVDRLIELVRQEQTPVSLHALHLLESDPPRPRLSDAGIPPLTVSPPRFQKNMISRGEVAGLLEKHPNADVGDKLLALELRAEEDPKNAGDYTKAGMEMFKGDAEAAPELAAWLYERGQFERVLEVVTPQRATRSKALYLWRIDALAALGRYTELKEMLLGEDAALDQTSQHMYLAAVSAKTGEPVVAANEWERALTAADSVAKLQMLSRYAEANNEPDIADRASVEVITQNPRQRGAYLARLRLAQAVGNTAGAHKIATQIIHLWPEDTATRFREVYLRLLLGGSPADIESAQAELDKLATANQSLGWNGRCTVALVYLRNGRPAAALNTLEQPGPGAPPPPNILAMRANALAANGWKDKARKEAQQLITARLLPEERAMIAPLLEEKPKL